MSLPWWGGVLAVLGVALSGWGAVRQWRRARLIEDTPTSRVRSAAQGYTELCGFVRAPEGQSIQAPLTAVPCVWFEYRIERYRRRGRSSRWETIERGRSEEAVVLDDDTGRCMIDPRHAEVITAGRRRWYGRRRHPRGGVAKGALSGVHRLLGGGRYRYSERWIAPGEWLYALGWFETLHAPSGVLRQRDRTRELLREWKCDREQLLARFDRDGDGEIDLKEWELARQAAARQARYHVLREPEDEPVHTLSCPPRRRQPYVLATRAPHALSRRYRYWAFALAVLAASLASGMLWILLGGRA